jgi:hypothetical protein
MSLRLLGSSGWLGKRLDTRVRGLSGVWTRVVRLKYLDS